MVHFCSIRHTCLFKAIRSVLYKKRKIFCLKNNTNYEVRKYYANEQLISNFCCVGFVKPRRGTLQNYPVVRFMAFFRKPFKKNRRSDSKEYTPAI